MSKNKFRDIVASRSFKVVLNDFCIFGILFVFSVGIGIFWNSYRGDLNHFQYLTPIERAVKKANPNLMGSQRETVGNISLIRLKELIANKEVLIIDVRRDLFFAIGNIENSLNLQEANYKNDLEKIKKIIDLAFSEEKEIVLYCSNIHCPDASKVAKLLLSEGYKNIGVFSGGWEEWQTESH